MAETAHAITLTAFDTAEGESHQGGEASRPTSLTAFDADEGEFKGGEIHALRTPPDGQLAVVA